MLSSASASTAELAALLYLLLQRVVQYSYVMCSRPICLHVAIARECSVVTTALLLMDTRSLSYFQSSLT
jgi:hypothetical protein